MGDPRTLIVPKKNNSTVCRVSQDDKKKVYLTDEINIGEVPCKINLVAEVDGLSLLYYTESTRKLCVLAMDQKGGFGC